MIAKILKLTFFNLNPKYRNTPIDTANTPSAPSGLIKNPKENRIPNVIGVKYFFFIVGIKIYKVIVIKIKTVTKIDAAV